MPEPHHILIPQLDIPATRDLLVIDRRTVRALQINHIRPYLSLLVPKLIPLLDIPKLDDSMLLRTARVVDGKIRNRVFATKEPTTPRPKLNGVCYFRAFEDIYAPCILG